MTFFTGNPSKIEGGGPKKLIPEGWHLAQVTAVVEGTSDAGNPVAMVDYIIIDGPADSLTLRDYVSGTEKSAWRKKWFLAELGFKEMLQDADCVIDAQDLVGKSVGVEVLHEDSRKENPATGQPYRNAKVNGWCKVDDLKSRQLKEPIPPAVSGGFPTDKVPF